jgi:hypothetical protein
LCDRLAGRKAGHSVVYPKHGRAKR